MSKLMFTDWLYSLLVDKIGPEVTVHMEGLCLDMS